MRPATTVRDVGAPKEEPKPLSSVLVVVYERPEVSAVAGSLPCAEASEAATAGASGSRATMLSSFTPREDSFKVVAEGIVCDECQGEGRSG